MINLNLVLVNIFFQWIIAAGYAQNLLEIDRQTYQLFSQGNYDTLKIIGNQELKNKNDFFFLRMRLGIVYYAEENYELALKHFERAYQFNDADSVLQEYLYFSYLRTNQQERATILLSRCSENMKQKLHYRPTGLLQIGLGTGFALTANNQSFAEKDILQQQQYAEGYFLENVLFGKISSQSIHNKKIMMFHAVQAFNTTTLGRTESPWFRVSQRSANLNLQYNAGLSWAFRKGWKAYLTAGFYRQSFSIYQFENINTTSTDTTLKTKISYQNVYDDYFSGVFGASKRFRYGVSFLGISFANFNQQILSQIESSITYFPIGNINLYGSTTLAVILQNHEQQLVISQSVGGKITPKLWYEVSGSYGNHQNYLAGLGFLTYNTFGKIRLMTGIDVKYYFKHLIINPLYRFNRRESSYFQITNNQNIQQPKFNFNNHLFSIVLTWKF